MEDNIRSSGDHHPPTSSSDDTMQDGHHYYPGFFQVNWQDLNDGLAESLGALASYASNPRDLVSIRFHWLEIHDGDRQNQIIGALHVTWQGITDGQQLLHQVALNFNYQDLVTGHTHFVGVLIIQNPLEIDQLIGALHLFYESTVSGGDLRYLGVITLRWRGVWNDGRGFLSYEWRRINPIINQIVQDRQLINSSSSSSNPQSVRAIQYPWPGINISLDRQLFELYVQRMNNDANQFVRDLSPAYSHYEHVGYLLLYSRGVNAGYDVIFGGVSLLLPDGFAFFSSMANLLS